MPGGLELIVEACGQWSSTQVTNSEGSTKSKWIFRSQKNHETARVWVSDREAFRQVTGHTTLFPGTDLVAAGWAEEEPQEAVSFWSFRLPESASTFQGLLPGAVGGRRWRRPASMSSRAGFASASASPPRRLRSSSWRRPRRLPLQLHNP